MTWVLRVREPEIVFVSHDDGGQLSISTDSRTALVFESQKDAETTRDSLALAEATAAWYKRAPQLIPVRMGSKSFIVAGWARVFQLLGCLSFFWVIRRLLPRVTRSYVFVEIWVLLWGAIAVGSLLILGLWKSRPDFLIVILGIIGGLRAAEIVIYQINVVLLDEWRSKRAPNRPPYAVRSYRRLVILTLHNYIEILIWFATFYLVEATRFHAAPDGLSLHSLSGAVYHSMLTMTTLGYGDIYPRTGEWLAASLATAQALIGVLLAVVVFARFIALMPRPLSMDEDEGA